MRSKLQKRGGRSSRRRSGPLSGAEIKRAGGIKQARKSKARGKVKSPRKAARKAAAPKAAPAVKKRRKARAKVMTVEVTPTAKPRKPRKARKAKAAAKKSSAAKPRKARKARATAPVQRRRRRSDKSKRAISLRLPRKARRVYVVAAERRRRARRGGSRRRHGAMENPLSGVELFVGSLLGLTGFAAGDLTDRIIATHALTGTAAPFTDTPPTSGTYQGLFNPTAICAPMNLARWANAVGVPAVLFTVAHFVKGPVVRSAMQFFAFGYGVRGVGKGVIDGLAKLTGNHALGQRLYDGELRAAALKTGNGTMPAGTQLPSAGLGRPALGAPCKCGGKCATCRPSAQQPGVGWPSMPRETAPQAQAQAPAPPAPNAPAPPAAPAAPTVRTTLTGPAGGAAKGGLFKPFGQYDH